MSLLIGLELNQMKAQLKMGNLGHTDKVKEKACIIIMF